MRLAIGAAGLTLLIAVTIGAAFWLPSSGQAASQPYRLVPTVIAMSPAGAVASVTDGKARIELPWLLPGDTGAVISPDGRNIAFSSARDGSTEIYVVNAITGTVIRLTDNPKVEDADPAWSPDGKRIAWVSGQAGARSLFTMTATGTRKHRLVGPPGNNLDPAWSPDGKRIAFASSREGRYGLWAVGSSGGDPEQLLDAPGRSRAPAWSPDGKRIAYVNDAGKGTDIWVVTAGAADQRRLTTSPAADGQPDWSPDGRRIAFVSSRGGSPRIWLMRADGTRQTLLPGSERRDDSPDWTKLIAAVAPSPSALLPDLDQRIPTDLVVIPSGGKYLLGFTSAVDNIGIGAIHIRGTRVGSARTMRADQIVHLRGGGTLVVPEVGRLAYEPHPPHYHWHLQPYERYELHRASDYGFVARDGKSGFCLLDRWGHAARRPGIIPGPPRFVGNCAALDPQARRVDEGSSIGYTDRYPAFFHGQDIDITGLAPGLYVLTHRANPEGLIRELRYSNNASSVRVRISYPQGRASAPAVEVVRRCRGTEQCPAP